MMKDKRGSVQASVSHRGYGCLWVMSQAASDYHRLLEVQKNPIAKDEAYAALCVSFFESHYMFQWEIKLVSLQKEGNIVGKELEMRLY